MNTLEKHSSITTLSGKALAVIAITPIDNFDMSEHSGKSLSHVYLCAKHWYQRICNSYRQRSLGSCLNVRSIGYSMRIKLPNNGSLA